MVHCFLKSFLFFGSSSEGDFLRRGHHQIEVKISSAKTTKTRSPLSELHMVLPTTTTVKMLVKMSLHSRRGGQGRRRCYISYPALHSYLAIKLRDCMCETNAFTFFSFPEKGRGERRLPSLKPTFFMTR